MEDFDTQAYGPQFRLLLQTNRCRPLEPATPVDSMRAELKSLSVETAFKHSTVRDPHMAACCLAAMWLLYDYLDESHAISQGIETPEGSYWHAIMHRREGDFSNSKYWFRRVGPHPTFEILLQRAKHFAEGDPQTDEVDALVNCDTWDPFAFVDLCQRATQGLPNVRQECELIQQAEWETLFDFCYRSATP